MARHALKIDPDKLLAKKLIGSLRLSLNLVNKRQAARILDAWNSPRCRTPIGAGLFVIKIKDDYGDYGWAIISSRARIALTKGTSVLEWGIDQHQLELLGGSKRLARRCFQYPETTIYLTWEEKKKYFSSTVLQRGLRKKTDSYQRISFFRETLGSHLLKNSFSNYDPDQAIRTWRKISKIIEEKSHHRFLIKNFHNWHSYEECRKWMDRAYLNYFLINSDLKRFLKYAGDNLSYLNAVDRRCVGSILITSNLITNEATNYADAFLPDFQGFIPFPGELELIKRERLHSSEEGRFDLLERFFSSKEPNFFLALYRKHMKRTCMDIRGADILGIHGYKLYQRLLRECGLRVDRNPKRKLASLTRELVREYENYIRSELSWPKVGEGWVGEVGLLRKIERWFPSHVVKHQWSPAFLGRQRIDIGLPNCAVGIEFHGTQHFRPIDFFGGVESYRNQCKRDSRKARLCKKNKVELLIFTEQHSDQFIRKKIKAAVRRQRKRLVKFTKKNVRK